MFWLVVCSFLPVLHDETPSICISVIFKKKFVPLNISASLIIVLQLLR